MYIADAQNPGVNVATAILQRFESIRCAISALEASWRTHFASTVEKRVDENYLSKGGISKHAEQLQRAP
jgi:hypothetical protein